MVRMTATYLGEKHCKVEHEPSKTLLDTDAPKDNQGRGESFSPTDLVATALGTCVLTTMAIMAEKDGVSLIGSRMSVEKVMSAAPRKIASLKTIIELPTSIPTDYREKLEASGNNCPVKRSLHPEVQADIEYRYTV
ncbi:OsmC family protein [Pseudobdellovibrio exovorus]|uniref:Putative stress-induced protein OsmC n=1 Tax=Pseudobdellovibrio exovorus JSS TaxID=1184267 RepID=M4V658_9BACT|nr:OsmC family protein [Pseudobdellovibrio exovorus]AGH94678.1 putative stress-induced protein OsmC [Pseudobdellovibrio exovorus JSS]